MELLLFHLDNTKLAAISQNKHNSGGDIDEQKSLV